jgi:hypothetical protein
VAESAASCPEVTETRLRRPPYSDSAALECGAFLPCIEGIVRNKCEQRFSSVTLTFNLYDAGGLQIGSADGSVRNLEAHGKARFGAMVLNPKIGRFKLDHVEIAPAR